MSLEEVRRDWTRLGADEPLWAVCVDPGKRGGRWDAEEFLATGEDEVAAALGRLEELGAAPSPGRALDFGCGAGRLSNALARRFSSVVGVDISEPMLRRARELDRSGGRIEFVLNTGPDLRALPDASVDLVYTDLVLQHLPPDAAAAYLREFARVARPGAALVLGVPDRERPTFKGLVFRYAPWPLIRLAQRVVLRYPAPMRMHTWPAERIAAELEAGAHAAGRPTPRILASDEYWGGDHWRHLKHFITVPSDPSAPSDGEDA
ncbi:class I SAM-dependent methyltransferase [Nocardiopsis chromatogenes]|uniref:class I SAM-dependent methyltransferase n=1 Tax=Nocardiopsis chromatogenes TaxID=280239 RepID=UPI00034CA3B4|nr:class I SAM-dependent methyltransferase [Nocardiopsis chromatogenes]